MYIQCNFKFLQFVDWDNKTTELYMYTTVTLFNKGFNYIYNTLSNNRQLMLDQASAKQTVKFKEKSILSVLESTFLAHAWKPPCKFSFGRRFLTSSPVNCPGLTFDWHQFCIFIWISCSVNKASISLGSLWSRRWESIRFATSSLMSNF